MLSTDLGRENMETRRDLKIDCEDRQLGVEWCLY